MAYVGDQYQATLPVWRPSAYANRATDQGIGRALWFVMGSDPERVAATMGIRDLAGQQRRLRRRCPPRRPPDRALGTACTLYLAS